MVEKELLGGFSFFFDMPQEQLAEIAQIGKVSEFDLNQTVFQYGDKAFDLYGVMDGEVELSITLRDKIVKKDIQYEDSIQTRIETIEKDIIIVSIEPGEIFGWSAFINPKTYKATAKCSQPASIILLPADKLKTLFDKNPQLGYVFMERLSETISQRLRSTTDKLVESWSEAFDGNRI